MAVKKASYTRGDTTAITPETAARPQGEAAALNEAVPAAPATPTFTPQAPPRQPQAPLKGMDELLAGPTDQPNVPITGGQGVGNALPAAVLDNIDALLRAAQDPNAPPAVRELILLADRHING